MRKKEAFLISSIIGSLLICASSANAEDTGERKPRTAKDPNEVVCRNIEKTGSLMSRQRKCLTRAEWDAEAANQRQLHDQWRDGTTSSTGGGG